MYSRGDGSSRYRGFDGRDGRNRGDERVYPRSGHDREDYYGASRSRERDAGDGYPPRGAHSQPNRRDRSRSRDRERQDYYSSRPSQDRGLRDDRRVGDYNDYQQDQYRLNPPSSTIIIKGLPPHATEPGLYHDLAAYSPQNIRLIMSRDTGECKGFAFVEFYSVEYAEHFMKTYAGSAGDANALRLRILDRDMLLDYARSDQSPHTGHQVNRESHGGDRRPPRTDWLCDMCGCQNFARRMECYKCSQTRGENAIAINQGETVVDPATTTETPSATLVAKGLPPLASEEQIAELFRQYALVLNVLVMRDWASGISRGIAFIEFHSVEHASHAKIQAADLKIGTNQIKVGYARPGYQKYFQNQNIGSTNPYAMAALQAAQWSANNAYLAAPGSSVQHPSAEAAAYLAAQAISIPSRLKSSKNWPPNFETEGAAYHFQPKSGCFLDPITQYYYCPRSKTYYNAATGEYFRYVGGDDPEDLYKRIAIPEPSGTEVVLVEENISSAAPTALPTGTSRKPIKLNIGLGGAKPKNKSVAPIMPTIIESKPPVDAVPATLLTSTTSSAFAKISENVLKWEERRKEERDTSPQTAFVVRRDSGASAVASAVAPATVSASANLRSNPVCLLCRRQFPSFDVLIRHEKESKLHADNLTKAAAAAASTQYRDRASERRILHPDEDNETDRKFQGEVNGPSEPTTPVKTPVAVAPLDQDEHNPGNALLRRMGWTSGAGLGKEGSGAVVPVALNELVSGAALAPGETTGVGSDGRIPHAAHGDDYKKNMYNATKARFDRLVDKSSNS